MQAPSEPSMAVKLSARQCLCGVVPKQVDAACAVSGIAAERLERKLTENVLLHDGEALAAVPRRRQTAPYNLVTLWHFL